MSEALLRVYHRLPAPARWAAVTAMGLYLRRWRFGADAERRVAAALERDAWPAARWQEYQQARLAYVLHRAATQVPYYREHWNERRRKGDVSSWDVLGNWPILEKDIVRERPREFVADDCDTRKMFEEHTSGTTGKPMTLWWSRETVREWYALNEARSRRWYGISRADRWAIVGGRLIKPVSSRKPPFWVWNGPAKQLYMSAYHLAPDLLPSYLDALLEYRIKYLFGYSSGLHALAEAALRLKRSDVRLTVAITNAEPLLQHQREAIEAAFHCPVRETYGLAEIVAGGAECERGRLHLWPEVGVVEAVNGNEVVPHGTLGDLVSTGILNADMPLIRYRTGDAIRLSGASCECGRAMPIVDALEGRSDDLVVTEDGRQVGRLDPVFKQGLGIAEAQIIQETLTQFRLRYVLSDGSVSEVEDELRRRLRDRVGNVEVIFEHMDQIPRTSNGKFRPVVSHVTRRDRQPQVAR